MYKIIIVYGQDIIKNRAKSKVFKIFTEKPKNTNFVLQGYKIPIHCWFKNNSFQEIRDKIHILAINTVRTWNLNKLLTSNRRKEVFLLWRVLKYNLNSPIFIQNGRLYYQFKAVNRFTNCFKGYFHRDDTSFKRLQIWMVFLTCILFKNVLQFIIKRS